MSRPWVGRSLRRREDHALLTGSAAFMADLARPGTLHVRFVRATAAHADITSISLEGARRMPGIVAVVTADELGADLPPQPSTHDLGTRPTPYHALARGRTTAARCSTR
ncbi:MAG: hypothetical protein ACE5GB_04290 [Acidimicrobiales bacterium]